MIRGSVFAWLVAICFAMAPAASEAKVLTRGHAVDDSPVRVIALTSAYQPGRLALDVISHPDVAVRVEWSVLCFGGPGPMTGGDFVAKQPIHRRVALPPRPRGLCHFEAEATFADPAQLGRIAVTLRGQVKRPPLQARHHHRSA